MLGGSVNYFNVVHWNMQGILDKIDDLNMLNMKSDSDVCCICEHWLGAGELSDIAVPGYYMASSYCRDSGRRGGVSIFVRSGIVCKELTYLVELSVQHICEVAAISIPEKNVVCLEVYRTPDDNNFNAFIDELCNLLSRLSCGNESNASIILSGDFNVNILNSGMKYLFL